MKKLLLLVTVVLLGSAAAWAQGTASPKAGETYTFSVTPTSAISPTPTLTTTFKVVTADGSGLAQIGATADILALATSIEPKADESTSVISAITGTWNSTDKVIEPAVATPHSVNIRWNGSSAGKYFYVIAKTNDGCADNYYVWEVTPAAGWHISNLQFVDADGAIKTGTDAGNYCPSNDIKVTYDATTPGTWKTTYGKTDIFVKVSVADLSGKKWTPTVTVKNDANLKTGAALSLETGQTNSIKYLEAAPSSTTPETAYKPMTTATSATEIWVRYQIDNTTWSSKDAQAFTIYVDGKDEDNVEDGAKPKDTTNDFIKTADDKVTTLIKARPQMTSPSAAKL